MNNQKATYEINLKDDFSKGFSKIDKSVDRFENKINRTTGRRGGRTGLGGLSTMAGTAAKGFAAIGGALVAADIGKKILTLGVNMEQTRIQFQTFFGSVEKGNAVLARLNEFSNVTPFNNEKVIQAGKTLASYGIEAQNLEPTLKLLGDVSAGTGKDLNEMAVIFGEIKSNGRLMGQDLRQLINAGFNPLQVISERTGKSVSTLKEEMSKGGITFADVEQAFKDATSEGGMFYDLMNKLSRTLGGRFSTLIGKLEFVGASLGESTLPVLAKILDGMISIVDTIPLINFDPIMNSVKAVTSSFTSLFDVFKDVINLFNTGNIEIDLVQQSINVLGLTMRAASVPLRALITGFKAFLSITDEIGESLKGVGMTLIGVFEGNKQLIATGLSQIASNTSKAFDSIGNDIKQFYQAEAKAFGQAFDFKRKKQEETPELSVLSGGSNTATSALGSGTQGQQAGREQVESSITGSAPKNITLNVQKLVEQINFNNQTVKESASSMTEQVKQALLTALNDAVIANR